MSHCGRWIGRGRAVNGIRQVDESGSVAVVTWEPHRPHERPPLSRKHLRGEVGLDRVCAWRPRCH